VGTDSRHPFWESDLGDVSGKLGGGSTPLYGGVNN